VIAKHPWGTIALVLSSLAGYNTNLTGGTPGQLNGTNLKVFEPQGDQYRVEEGSTRRLLIRSTESHTPSAEEYRAKFLLHLGQERKFTDCKVCCRDEEFACHRSVFAQASPVFERMLETEISEGVERCIRLDAKKEVVKAMVEFIYSGSISIEKEDVPGLIAIADCYQLSDLLVASSKHALEVIDANIVGQVVQSMRVLATKPEGKPFFDRLIQTLKDHDELLRAAILDI